MDSDSYVDDLVVSSPLAPVKRCCAALSSLPSATHFPHARACAHVHLRALPDRGRSARPVRSGRCAGRAPPTLHLRGLLIHTGPARFVPRVSVGFTRAFAVGLLWWQRGPAGGLVAAKPGFAPLSFLLARISPSPPLGAVPDGEGHLRRLALSVSYCVASLLGSGRMLPLPLRAHS